ncbi:MAG: hypothetical protein BWY69_00418 [Planctomycetes bacterium ADurb.Bin401]|nr:MAG: hypothetical protein BWY69_00418 [Planctomycetes bacterium ADurb.Bin401]
MQIHIRLEPHMSLLHIRFRNAEKPNNPLQFYRKGFHFFRAVYIRLSHNLQQRRSRPVKIDLRCDARVDIFARVFFKMNSAYSDLLRRPARNWNFYIPVRPDWQIVLTDLIILRQIRIIITFPVPFREFCDFAVQRRRR